MACATPLVADAESDTGEARRIVTVVFSDLVGSTKLGEALDPESLRQVMSLYYEAMRSEIEAHGGIVAKFIGDAVMGAFGIRTVNEDDALRAVRAADGMRAALAVLNEELRPRWGVGLEARTGVNTGEVVTGDPTRGEELIVGDAVNVAARLEQAAPPGEILIGPLTSQLVTGTVEVDPVAPLQLKGKSAGVRAFRVVDLASRDGVPEPKGAPLIGRADELSRLETCFEDVVSEPRCTLATVMGPAGVGKSRLVTELVASIGGRARFFRGRCLPYGDGITLWPIAEIVRSAVGLGATDRPADAVGQLAALWPDPAEGDVAARGLARAVGLTPGATALEATFLAVRRFVEALARTGPVVLVFDDIQWAEETLLDLLHHLARSPTGSPVLLLCTARPELLEQRSGWADEVDGAVLIDLDPLGDGPSRQLVDALLGSEPSREISDRITSAAAGNPLFIEETVRMLLEEKRLRSDGGAWQIEESSEVAMPPTIHAILAARLGRLSTAERAVLERASVIGQGFWRGAVEELTPEAQRPGVETALAALVQKQLVTEGGEAFSGQDPFEFSHLLVRDVAYAGILRAARADLHERFGGWLERNVGARLGEYEEIVGYHFEQAYRQREALAEVGERGRQLACKASGHLAAAGGRAYGRGDMPATVKLLERAFGFDRSVTAERLELMLRCARALFEIGGYERAHEMFDEIERTARDGGMLEIELRARLGRSDLRTWTEPDGNLDELRRVAEEAIPVFEASGDELGLAKAWRNLGTFHNFGCRWGQAAELLERALVHANRAGDEQMEAEILPGLAMMLWLGPMPVDDALERLREAVARATRGDGGSDSGLVTLGTWEAIQARGVAGLEAMRGNLEAARSICQQAKSVLAEVGQSRQLADVRESAGWIEMLAGDPMAAELELRASYEALKGMGEKAVLSLVAAELAEALLAQGRDDEADRLSGESRMLAADDDVESQVRWRRVQAALLARGGASEEAEHLARLAVERARATESPNLQGDALMALAEILQGMSRLDEAAALAADAFDRYTAKGNVVSAEQARALIGDLQP